MSRDNKVRTFPTVPIERADTARVMPRADSRHRLKTALGVLALAGVVASVVVWAYTSFETRDAASDKVKVYERSFAEHKAGAHERTAEELRAFDVRITRIEVVAEHRGKQVDYLVNEVKKIGERVGSDPAPPPVMPDAVPAAKRRTPY